MNVRLLMVLVMGMLLEGTSFADHTALLSKNEEKCQLKAAAAFSKFRTATIKCMEKCDRDLQKGLALPGDCNPPAGGGATAVCFQKASAKAIKTIPKKCTKDCPECYGGGCSLFAMTQVPTAAGNIAVLVSPLFCNTDPNLTSGEAKCRQKMALAGEKYAAALTKCRIKCRKAEFKQKLPLGASCNGPTNDPKTLVCFATAASKFSTACQQPCSDLPDCVPTGPDCADFAAAMEGQVLQYDPIFFCMS